MINQMISSNYASDKELVKQAFNGGTKIYTTWIFWFFFHGLALCGLIFFLEKEDFLPGHTVFKIALGAVYLIGSIIHIANEFDNKEKL